MNTDKNKAIPFRYRQESLLDTYELTQKNIKKSYSTGHILHLDDDAPVTGSIFSPDFSTLKKYAHETGNLIRKQISRESVVSLDNSENDVFADEIKQCFKEKDNFSLSIQTSSLESLTEYGKESDESSISLTPPPKISIRNKISSRLNAAIEKRRLDKEKDVTLREKKTRERTFFWRSSKSDTVRTSKKIRMASVTIGIIEAQGLDHLSVEHKLYAYQCRFQLNNEKIKTKPGKVLPKYKKVEWMELHNINLYDDYLLQLSLTDKDQVVGKNEIDLRNLKTDKTYKLKVKLREAPKIQIFFLLTISGVDFMLQSNHIEHENDNLGIASESDMLSDCCSIDDNDRVVGNLNILIYAAVGLSGQDCYCVLELNNERRRTQTEYKNSSPRWMKLFDLTITDITSILEFSIIDEKRNEEVAKLWLPLLNIENGHKKWYSLKDSSLRERAKGQNPRILLETKVTWNVVAASLRVINPKEKKYFQQEAKVNKQTFSHNFTRTKAVISWVLDAIKVIKNIFEWERRRQNSIALVLWIIACWIFRVWMTPLLFFVPFVWYCPQQYRLINSRKLVMKILKGKQGYVDDETLAEKEKDKKDDKEKTTLRKKIQSLQDTVLAVQSFLGHFGSYGESIKNLFNFTVPYLSMLAIFFLSAITVVLYFIPLRYIFMIWGIHKYSRKILRPNRIPNNEILDLLSRVPDDDTLLDCEELPLEEEVNDIILSDQKIFK